MMTVNLIGGLGNNLFQLASAYGIAKENGHLFLPPYWGAYNRFFPNYKHTSTNRKSIILREHSFSYTRLAPRQHLDYELQGYFQSARYFDKYREDILYLFTLAEDLGGAKMKEINSVGVHVRRGDYLKKQDCHPVLPMSYYMEAMELFKGSTFVIFSDDDDWCRKQDWGGHEVYFSTSYKDVQALRNMSICRHNIIANSSFSWWGAYLNQREGRMVVAPKQWFGPKLPHDTKDLIPNEWITL